jgi:hypothetical protein
MTKISDAKGTIFDGVNHPYVPARELKISPKLKLHRACTEDFDPVSVPSSRIGKTRR